MDAADEHEPGTSVSTIRGIRQLDMLFPSEPVATSHDSHPESSSPYRPSSPHSMFQSEPGSPSGDSISSLPSVSSSFHFSSGPTSPPHPGPASEPEDEGELGDSTKGLVIPSLTLPSPSRNPTPYGQALGEVRLLLLGPKGADTSAIASQLVDNNEDVVEVGIWEEVLNEVSGPREKRKAVLRVSTHWVEHRDRHGLQHIEPARNVEIVGFPAYDSDTEASSLAERVLSVVHSPFREVTNILNSEQPPSGLLARLLSSPFSPLYTALVLFATPSALSQVEKVLIEYLSPHIPIVILPPPPSSAAAPSYDWHRKTSVSHLSAFRPSNIDDLRAGIFRTPDTLTTLRSEAAARFLRWREVERAVERLHRSTRPRSGPVVPPPPSVHTGETKQDLWDKKAWEAQWEDSLSQEVALHMRRLRSDRTVRRMSPLSPSLSTITRGIPSPPRKVHSADNDVSPPCPSATFDPLHIPSLVVFSFSLFGALRTRVARSLGLHWTRTPGRVLPTATSAGINDATLKAVPSRRGITFGLGLALVGAFCAGVGIGLVAASRF